MAEIDRFRIRDALFIIGSIITFIADQATDIILAVTFGMDGLMIYCGVTLVLVLLPNIIIQIFSARWNKIDETFNGPVKLFHACLLGTLHRYYMVLKTGLEARQSGDVVDYQRYYQQWSDICMLRLFDSFMESGPQLVFQLYILLTRPVSSVVTITWISVSAVASTVSLGWGVAAYSQALRLVRQDKGRLSWMGMVLQTTWRFFMLSARTVALVLLCLALNQWALVVIFVHWLLMTAWVIWQKTDFCTNVWEERLYNAVVGVIYCFCFFNLKEGRSRYRMAVFYTVTFVENLTFVGAYYWSAHHSVSIPVSWFSLGAMVIVLGGTAVGLCSMVLYYRFYHPAGPITWSRQKVSLEGHNNIGQEQAAAGNDYVIKNATYVEEKEAVTKKVTSLKPSRSFKQQTLRKPPAPAPPPSPPPPRPQRQPMTMPSSPPAGGVVDNLDLDTSPHHDDCKVSEKMDSAYGTDSNRTASRNTESSPVFAPAPVDNLDISGGSNKSSAFNNDTYMSIENTPVVETGHSSNNNTYQSVHAPEDGHDTSQDSQLSRVTVIDQSCQTPKRPRQDLLKRSPVMKDVVSSTPVHSSTVDCCDKTHDRLHAPLTIIIPNISNQAFTKTNSQSPDKWSDKTISLDILAPNNNSSVAPADISNLTSHDYENLALVNINRAPLGPFHWRTYSDMANSKHDDSEKYEKNKLNFTSSSEYSTYSNLAFCDIYPLSRAMKHQLYRSLTPVSTQATLATSPDVSDLHSNHSNHTYEPIENAAQAFSSFGDYANAASHNNIPVTLIHHDGHRMTANKITSLESLRETLITHEQIPYDDPENRGDLYILAPMRLLTPIMEETDSELTRSKVYQELSSSLASRNPHYSTMDTSIMSIISEVLSVRQTNQSEASILSRDQAYANYSSAKMIDTNCLLSTIEEIRNNSMCNLYQDQSKVTGEEGVQVAAGAPQVPPRGTMGYQSLCKENSKSKERNEQQDLVDSFRAKQEQRSVVSPETETEDVHNESIKSINSNTLVTTPNTVKAKIPAKKTPLQSGRGCRKNILNLVTNTKDILNTPKRVKVEPLTVAPENNIVNESVATENEFKALMPHLTYTGVKFLKNVTKTADDSDMNGSILQGQGPASSINASVKERLSFASPSSNNSSKLSVFTNTPSPVTFVRNIGNQKRPTRKLSIVREKRDVEDVNDDNNSDYKYGFVKENPDAKYGFGFFPTDSYNVLETAKLSNNSYRGSFNQSDASMLSRDIHPANQRAGLSSRMNPVIDQLQESIDSLTRLNHSSSVNANNKYSLSALNKADTVFKLHPDETYENLQRNNWVSSSLQRRGPPRPALLERDTVTRRSMSILDDMNDEKENILPRQMRASSGSRVPLGSINSLQTSLNQPPVHSKVRPPMGSNSSSHFIPIRKTSVS